MAKHIFWKRGGVADKYIKKNSNSSVGGGGGGYCCAFYLIFYSYFVNLPYHVLLNKWRRGRQLLWIAIFYIQINLRKKKSGEGRHVLCPPPLFPDDTCLFNLFCVISTELKKHCWVTDSLMTSLHRKTTVFILKIFKKYSQEHTRE